MLNGIIPISLPSSLVDFEIGSNLLTGPIPSVLPTGLKTFMLRGNFHSGDLPIFPSTVARLYLGFPGYSGNQFTGTLRLNQPILLFINSNLISDIVIQDSSQVSLSVCDLSDNPLLGGLNIASLAMCVRSSLYTMPTGLVKTTTAMKKISPLSVKAPDFTSTRFSTTMPTLMIEIITSTNSFSHTLESRFETTSVHEFTADDVIITAGDGATEKPNVAMSDDFGTTFNKSNKTGLVRTSMTKSIIKTSFHSNKLTNELGIFGILQMVLRSMLDILVLVIVLRETPFKRIWKNRGAQKKHGTSLI